jgi:hypothetical protein
MNRLLPRATFAALLILGVNCSLHSAVQAQTTVEVNAGQILSEADLIAGSFQGAQFELGPATVFNINDGGILDRLGESVFPFSPFDFHGSTVNVNAGGTFGDAPGGPETSVSHVTINLYADGTILRTFRPAAGAVVNVYGGVVDYGYRAISGSTNNIHGGIFSDFVALLGGSVTNIAGGQFWFSPTANSGSNVTLTGGEFKLNGVPLVVADQTLEARTGVLSGTFANGTPFVLDSGRFHQDANISLNLVDLPMVDTTPIFVDAQNEFDGTGLRLGQSLTLRDGGVLGSVFTVDGAILRIEGGEIGEFLRIIDSDVSISGGIVSFLVDVYTGSTVDITGGTILGSFDANDGSMVNIRGGSIGRFFQANSGSIVNISGGEVGEGFSARPGSIVDISGGQIDPSFGADPGSTVNLFVQRLSLDGLPIELQFGELVTIDVEVHDVLDAVLADGTPVRLDLNRHPKDPTGVAEAALLTVTRVPEPASWLMLSGNFLLLYFRRHRIADKVG